MLHRLPGRSATENRRANPNRAGIPCASDCFGGLVGQASLIGAPEAAALDFARDWKIRFLREGYPIASELP